MIGPLPVQFVCKGKSLFPKKNFELTFSPALFDELTFTPESYFVSCEDSDQTRGCPGCYASSLGINATLLVCHGAAHLSGSDVV